MFSPESHRRCLASYRRLHPRLSASAGLSPPAPRQPHASATPAPDTPTHTQLYLPPQKEKRKLVLSRQEENFNGGGGCLTYFLKTGARALRRGVGFNEAWERDLPLSGWRLNLGSAGTLGGSAGPQPLSRWAAGEPGFSPPPRSRETAPQRPGASLPG